jgi:hypothetical protein
LAHFAWISQVNSIDNQVKGYEDKTGLILTPTEGATEGGCDTPSLQEKEKEKEKEQEVYRKFSHLSLSVSEKNKILADGYTIEQLDNTLDKIENYTGNKKYKSLNLTARQWLKKDVDIQKQKKKHIGTTMPYQGLI